MLLQKLLVDQALEILKLRARLLMKVQIDEKGDLYRHNNLSSVKIMKKRNFKVADFDLQHFLKFSGKVYGKLEIKKKHSKIVEIGLLKTKYLL